MSTRVIWFTGLVFAAFHLILTGGGTLLAWRADDAWGMQLAAEFTTFPLLYVYDQIAPIKNADSIGPCVFRIVVGTIIWAMIGFGVGNCVYRWRLRQDRRF